MHKPKLLLLTLVIALLFAAVLPAAAAPGATINSITVNAASCTMTLTFTVQDAGTYYVNVWDDGNFRDGDGIFIPAGGTATATMTIGVVLQGAAGIGLYVEDGLGPAASTTFASDGSFQPNAPACLGTWTVSLSLPGASCANWQPENFVVRPVPNGAHAYWAPAIDKSTDFDLPAGTWYTSREPVDGFYEVWIACPGSNIFIPAANVG